MGHRAWLAGISAIALSAAMAPAAARAADDNTPSPEVEEVVVTAQRRSENAQKVPIAISVVTAEQAAALGVRDSRDLTQLVTGLNFTSFTTQATPVIRGVGTNVVAQGDENDVAIYVDGIYQQTPNTAIFNLADVERIEVIKGPQGTLFGRNAVGGVINVTTINPTQQPRLAASAAYGSYETFTGTALVSGGVAENLAASLAAYYNHQGKGYGRNLFNGADVYKSWQMSLRNRWRWTPSEATSVGLSAAYNQSEDDSVCLRLSEGELGPDGRTRSPGFYNSNADATCYVKVKSFDGGLNLEHDLGFGTLVSNTGYNRVEGDRPGDSDNTPVFIQNAQALHQEDEGVTQELQLQSPAESKLKWITGYFYFNGKSGYPEPGIVIVPATGTTAYTQILGSQKVVSHALFAQGTMEVLPRTSLTLGARYTSDKRTVDGQVLRLTRGATTPTVIVAGADNTTFDKFTWRFALDHQLTDQVLLYGSVSTGFKAGLYNLTSPANPAVNPETLTAYELGFKSSLLDRRLQINGSAYFYTYEDLQVSASLVVNGAPLSRVFNAATAEIKGFDLDVRAAPAAGLNLSAGVSYTDARYESYPTAVAQVPDPRGVIVGGRPTVVVFDAAGKSLLKAPEWTLNLGGDYTVPLADGEVTFAANVSHMSKFYWNVANTFVEPSKTLVNASVNWKPNDTYRVTLWGRNLLDEEHNASGIETARGFIGIPAAPATYGVTLGVQF